ncbi:MAG: hypothetical protein UW72_C0009G0020 [Parcubacteria group bacterium GW2011_GWF2_44_7]|nr:MAG: hypothetical protein UW72_C0009G0020 [Parcubacteria group bacterium GW2011_GWF2_44_7]
MSTISIIGIILTAGGFLGAIIIISRKMPVLAKLSEENLMPKKIFRESLVIRFKSIKYSSLRPLLFNWLEKVLRKLRLSFLKIDNIFLTMIGQARENSQTWSIRSKAWLEHRRLKKKQKIQVLEELDKVEISEGLDKVKREVSKDEDKAFKQKIEIVAKESEPTENLDAQEKDLIDAIAKKPKNIEAYKELGFLYLKKKNFPDARSCFRQVLKLNPEEIEIGRKLEEIIGLEEEKPAEGAWNNQPE